MSISINTSYFQWSSLVLAHHQGAMRTETVYFTIRTLGETVVGSTKLKEPDQMSVVYEGRRGVTIVSNPLHATRHSSVLTYPLSVSFLTISETLVVIKMLEWTLIPIYMQRRLSENIQTGIPTPLYVVRTFKRLELYTLFRKHYSLAEIINSDTESYLRRPICADYQQITLSIIVPSLISPQL